MTTELACRYYYWFRSERISIDQEFSVKQVSERTTDDFVQDGGNSSGATLPLP